jgi:hypothetical protein
MVPRRPTLTSSSPPILDPSLPGRLSRQGGDLPFPKAALGVLLLLVVGLYVGLGAFASPMSDDFSHLASLRQLGLWGYVVKGYTHWYGIYSGWVWIGSIESLFELGSLTRWQPLFQVTLSLGAIFLFLSAFKDVISLSTRAWLTLFIQAAWLSITEGLSTYFYWTTASMIYYGGNTLAVFQAACLARIVRSHCAHKSLMTVVLSLLVFVSAGFAADVAVVQVLMYGGLAVAWRWHGLRHHSRRMAIVTGIALLAFGLVYFSPATRIRMQVESVAYGTHPQSIAVTLSIAAKHGLLTWARFFSKPILYLVILFMPLLGRVPVIGLRREVRLWHILAIGGVVSCFFQALHGWSRGVELPERMIARVYWNMAAVWSLFFIFFYRNPSLSKRIEGHWIYRKRHPVLAACLLLNSNFLGVVESYTAGPACARQVDALYGYVAGQKAAGNLDLAVPAVSVSRKLFPCTDLTGNRNHWVNKAFAEVMGLRSVRSVRLPAEADSDYSKIRSLADARNPEAAFIMGQLCDPRNPPLDNKPSDYSTWEPMVGVPPAKDTTAALQWYMKAACQGHKPAQRMLVGFLAGGLGVERSFGGAARWFLTSRIGWPGPGALCK